jgi:F-type H+-transporting ATPase subunit epsilon
VARTPFQVEILTPEGEVFNEEVEQLSTRTTTGSIGILANHTPLLAMLEPAELRLYRSESDVVRLVQGEGYLQVGNNRAMLLLEEAHPPGDLDVALLRERLSKAEQALSAAEHGTEEERRALRDKRRWETFLGIAEAG